MNALIVMTRVPIPGKTKTRLMDILSGTECARLHEAFLQDLMITFKAIEEEIDIHIAYTPEDSAQLLRGLIPSQYRMFPQRGADLGERMMNGIQDVMEQGYEKVIVIGSDIPNLKSTHIQAAFHLLEEKDIVIGPCFDGGYYLIGMKDSHGAIFELDKQWGGTSVLEATIHIANRHGLFHGFAAQYRDIDTKEDLFQFELEGGEFASNTMTFIRDWRNRQWTNED